MIPKAFGLSRCRSPEDKGLLCKSQTPVANNQGLLVRIGWEKMTRSAWRREPYGGRGVFLGTKVLVLASGNKHQAAQGKQ